MQEDHVSMGWAAGRKLRRAVDGLGRVLAIEIAHRRTGVGPASAAAAEPRHWRGRRRPARTGCRVGPDRFLAPEIEYAVQLVASGRALAAAESVTGPLA
jgi:histidine ammonia-lyase